MPGNPLTDPNWAPDLADTIERIVGSVRDNATNRAVTAARGVVFGIVIAVASLAALTLLVIVANRLLQQLVQLIPGVDYGRSVWLSYVIVGGLLLLAGLFTMTKRFAAPDEK